MTVSRAVPPLSVGMPIYNGERYAASAIESILNQSFCDFEFIISDNASTDNTEEICRYYAAHDRRISYSRLPENRGAAPNFNRVFLLSSSPFFKFAAADDMCESRFLEVCMTAHHEANGSAALCFPTTVKIDAEGRRGDVIRERMDLRQVRPHERFRAFLRDYWLANCFYGVVRSDAYRSTRLLKSYDAADIALLGELALRGQFWQLNEPLFLRRFHAGMSHKINSTPEEIRHWLQPTARHSRALPKTHMFWGFARAIDTTQMSTTERMRCRRAFASVWVRKYWKTMAKEAAEGFGIPVPRSAMRSK